MNTYDGAVDGDQIWRLARFCAQHPEVEIGAIAGMRQATIPLPRGSETITRPLLADLLDELDKRFPPVGADGGG
ncbi:MAG TPA: hypothetical protein VG123_37955 [Streptosporangiaceae bacterium]|jgi:hypothetical protein|nr:hypothetical protein [Streptosporangiaceae bacterium]